MSARETRVETEPAPKRRSEIELVPRLAEQGYDDEQQAERREWVAEKTGATLDAVGRHAIPGRTMRGNIENPIGAAQVPLGVAGPLRVRGEHAEGTFYVPLATTEGALVRSYERGMVALTRAGGAVARVWRDENVIAPAFVFASPEEAADFARDLPRHFDAVRAACEATTRHGKLLRLEPAHLGRRVRVVFAFTTGDAQGMNMIARATDAGCRWLVEHSAAERYLLFTGWSSEKRPSGMLLGGGKGKTVTASCVLPWRVVRAVLRVDPEQIVDLWHHTVLGHLEAGALGYNGHVANGLTALFLATGQDVANVANAAVGITHFETTPDGSLSASVELPALTVATVGGGTGLATARECLAMLDCVGAGKARRFAEIAASMALAGELSMGAALASGEFVDAHETYGRNRPDAPGDASAEDASAEGKAG